EPRNPPRRTLGRTRPLSARSLVETSSASRWCSIRRDGSRRSPCAACDRGSASLRRRRASRSTSSRSRGASASSARSRSRTAMALALSLLVSACASSNDAAKLLNPDPPDKMYAEADQLLSRGKYEAAAKKFEDLDRDHPYSPEARRAMVMAAYAYYRAGKTQE